MREGSCDREKREGRGDKEGEREEGREEDRGRTDGSTVQRRAEGRRERQREPGRWDRPTTRGKGEEGEGEALATNARAARGNRRGRTTTARVGRREV